MKRQSSNEKAAFLRGVSGVENSVGEIRYFEFISQAKLKLFYGKSFLEYYCIKLMEKMINKKLVIPHTIMENPTINYLKSLKNIKPY